jgi:surface protein
MESLFQNAKNFDQDLSSLKLEGSTPRTISLVRMLSDTALSPYHYNALLDARSQQNVPRSVAFHADPAQYGGCEVNAQAGIDGHNKLFFHYNRYLGDKGILNCPSKGTVVYQPDVSSPTKGPVTVTVTTYKPLLSGLDDRTFLGNNQYQKLYTENRHERFLVRDADGEGMIEISVDHIERDDFSGSGGAFITTWYTSFPGDTIFIPTYGDGYDFEVDWGDGVKEIYTGTPGNLQHTYTTPGNHQVWIKGTFPQIYLDAVNPPNNTKLRRIDQWGDIVRRDMGKAFYRAVNLTISAKDSPNLSQVTNMSDMFYGAENLTGNFSGWDTSHVENMGSMFEFATNFNSDISNWDTSNVTIMSDMFYSARAFNQDLSRWNIKKVISMNHMFSSNQISTYNYNQLLSGWSRQIDSIG